MKTIALLILSTFACTAQPSLTTVAQVIYDGAGQRVTGTCTYRLLSGRATSTTFAQIVGEPVTVRFTNGAFSMQIVPTDTMTPSGQYYSASCSGSRGWSKTGSWIVPTSGSAVLLDDIWVATPPAPAILIPPPQLDARHLTTGTYCLNVVNGVITGLVPCTAGGGTTPLSWAALTNSQWTSMTDSQWTAITD